MPLNCDFDNSARPVGATRLTDECWEFCVWAPKRNRVELHLLGANDRYIEMAKCRFGYFSATVSDINAGADYLYRLDGSVERPDPASRFQPEGVHGPSRTVDTGSFAWTDQAWNPPPLEQSIFYELHAGTYTPEGTFDS